MYNVQPTVPALMVDPPIMKTVVGDQPASNGVFTFKLVANNPLQSMPSGSKDGVKTIAINGPGQGEFGTWSYDKAGTYTYTAYEVKGSAKGYTYDTAVYTITDIVKDENARLVLSRTVTNDSGAVVTSMYFVNEYADPGSGTGEGKPGPKTGDDTNTALYYTLFAISGAVMSALAVYLIAGRKRKKSDAK